MPGVAVTRSTLFSITGRLTVLDQDMRARFLAADLAARSLQRPALFSHELI
jgi:hypothetical protein